MGVEAAAAQAPARRGRAWAQAALGGWVLAVDAWFEGPLLGGRLPPAAGAWLLLALFAAFAVAAARAVKVWRPGPFALTVLGMLVLATLVRLPALAAPGS